MVDKSGLTEVEKTGKNHYFLVWKQGPGAYGGRVKVTWGRGGRGAGQALFRRPLRPFRDARLSVSCPADIDLLMDDLRINVVFR